MFESLRNSLTSTDTLQGVSQRKVLRAKRARAQAFSLPHIVDAQTKAKDPKVSIELGFEPAKANNQSSNLDLCASLDQVFQDSELKPVIQTSTDSLLASISLGSSQDMEVSRPLIALQGGKPEISKTKEDTFYSVISKYVDDTDGGRKMSDSNMFEKLKAAAMSLNFGDDFDDDEIELESIWGYLSFVFQDIDEFTVDSYHSRKRQLSQAIIKKACVYLEDTFAKETNFSDLNPSQEGEDQSYMNTGSQNFPDLAGAWAKDLLFNLPDEKVFKDKSENYPIFGILFAMLRAGKYYDISEFLGNKAGNLSTQAIKLLNIIRVYILEGRISPAELNALNSVESAAQDDLFF